MHYAVIGTGWIVDSYIQGAALTGKWELAAVCSRSREKGLQFGSNYGISTVYTSVEELAADPAVEAVYVASPNRFHYEQSKLLLNAGKHVLCEKPITVSPEECEELQQLAAAKELAAQLEKSSITVSIKAGEGGKAFGCVSSKEIASAIASQLSLDIDKKKLVLPEPLKTFGVHEVPIKLHKEVTGKLAVKVVES